jgi:hypothetical protein
MQNGKARAMLLQLNSTIGQYQGNHPERQNNTPGKSNHNSEKFSDSDREIVVTNII